MHLASKSTSGPSDTGDFLLGFLPVYATLYHEINRGGEEPLSNEKIKSQILRALGHPEAEEGLYFRNLFHLHEEDERQAVEGEEIDILVALNELIEEGKVLRDESGEEQVFLLAS